MGSSFYTATSYVDHVRSLNNSDPFAYTKTAQKTGAKEPHADLNPKNVMREARDSADHPESVPIMIWFDQTGSMQTVPRIMQKKLPNLMNLLLQKGFTKDPQICFSAIGDAKTGEPAPVQVGQFESDIRMVHDLEKIYLVGMGGGNYGESYDLAMYFSLNHVTTDAWEKRKKKGYLFLIGDEPFFSTIDKSLIEDIFGDAVATPNNEPIQTKDIMKNLQEKWHVFFIMPSGTSYWNDQNIINLWKGLVGPENVVLLEDPEAIAECIAGIIGLFEGNSYEFVENSVRETSSAPMSQTISRALSTLKGKTDLSKNSVKDTAVLKAGQITDLLTSSEDEAPTERF